MNATGMGNLKFIGSRRAAAAHGKKRAVILAASQFGHGTRPRAKTFRRYRKQELMGLSLARKVVVDHGRAKQPTKVRMTYPARKIDHPNKDARKVGAPFYVVDR